MSELRPLPWVIAAAGNHLPPDAWGAGRPMYLPCGGVRTGGGGRPRRGMRGDPPGPSSPSGTGSPCPSAPAVRASTRRRCLPLSGSSGIRLPMASRVAFPFWYILCRRQGTIGRHCHNLLHQLLVFAAYCGNFRISCSPPPHSFPSLLSLGEPREPLLPHRLEPGHKPHVPSIKAAHSDHLLSRSNAPARHLRCSRP